MAHKMLFFVFLYFTSALALSIPLAKRVTFNFVWDIADPLPNQDQYQSLVEDDFRTEMQGIYEMATVARDYIADNGAGARSSSFGFYFGLAPTPLDALTIRSNFQRVIDLATNNRQLTIRFTDRDSTEWPGAQAYATASGTLSIYLPRYEAYTQHRHWVANPFEQVALDRTQTRSNIILHELFHITGIGQQVNGQPLIDCEYPEGYDETFITRNGQRVRNFVYGQTAANRLVRRSGFEQARRSAENHSLFAFSKYTKYE